MKYIRIIRETGERIEVSRVHALRFVTGFYREPDDLLGQLEDKRVDRISGPSSDLVVEG